MKKLLLLFSVLFLSLSFIAKAENKCLMVTTPSAGANSWDHQISFKLEKPMAKGESYKLTALIKADVNTKCGLWTRDNQSSNKDQWGGTTDVQYLSEYNITTEWQEFSWSLTAQFPNDDVTFVFGTLGGSIFFDDVKLVDVNVGVNMITNGDFAESSSKGWSHPSYTGEILEIVANDYVAPEKPQAPEIPETWEIVEQGNPNFHVYLCFGQSNMEGATQPEAIDKVDVPERFKMMAAVDFSNPKRTQGEWYTAVPPLCRQGTGLTPADYFGRTLVEKLPEEVSVGVINVAVGGAKIELFMEEEKDAYIKGEADWFKNSCAQYNNDPLGRLIELGKKAQEIGTIKGILLHQGESNNGQSDWAKKVAMVYTRICYYLGLDPKKTPLLAGETLYENMGGGCSWHNTAAMPKLKDEIPNSYVISAKDLPGNGVDAWHFSAAGYREIGKRYAEKMLEILATDGIETVKTESTSTLTYDLFGNPADDNTTGVVIMEDKKVLKK